MQERTIEILKNFATINTGLIFKPGKVLRTISVQKNIFAKSEIPDEISREFAIYDLNEFLSTLSLFDKPEIAYKEDHVLIQSGKSRIKYYYSSSAVVVAPPEQDINLHDPIMEFRLTEANLNQIMKASAALKLDELSFSDGKITAYSKNSGSGATVSGNSICIDLEEYTTHRDADKAVAIDHLKIIPGTYDVKVFEAAVRFENTKNPDLIYFVTVKAE